MYYEIKEISADLNSNIYVLVEFWLCVEDKYLNLQPILTNDFIMELTDVNTAVNDIKMNIENFARRSQRYCWAGDARSLQINKTNIDRYGIVGSSKIRELVGKGYVV